ncbi:MAG: hypothetical protein JNM43_19355 [Planctomycetaceae bacterium]|nr:hypothetical protein [Planctomycetaceae bacterium]
MGNRMVSRFAPVLILTTVSITGCTSLCDAKYEMTQKIRTCKAWYECDTDCLVTGDYKHGWKAGYYDVITGGTGCPPVVAPSKYWTPPLFTQYDPSRRDDWYRGFQDGAACAKCEPELHYLQTFMPPRCQTQPASFHREVPEVPAVPEATMEPEVDPNAPMNMPAEAPVQEDKSPIIPEPEPAPAVKPNATQQYDTAVPRRKAGPLLGSQRTTQASSTFRTPPIKVKATASEDSSLLKQLVANSRSE